MDTQIFYFFNNLAGLSPISDAIVIFFATYLPYFLIVIFLAFVYLFLHSWRERIEILGISFLATLVSRGILTELIRTIYNRPRPFTALLLPPEHQLFTDPAWSFPSGHATFFFALATVVYLYHKRWGTWFFAAAVIVTVSRVIAGVHYPSDILGGAIIGIGIAYGTYALSRRFTEMRSD